MNLWKPYSDPLTLTSTSNKVSNGSPAHITIKVANQPRGELLAEHTNKSEKSIDGGQKTNKQKVGGH